MTDEKLFETLKLLVEQGNFFATGARDALVQYKNEGGLQTDAQNVAEQLRAEFVENEELEDRVLDILDVITGWCSPALRVWE